MTKLLLWAPVVQELEKKTKEIIARHQIQWYLAIFMLGDNHPWTTYVRKKTEYAKKLWLTTKVFTTIASVDEDIVACNTDSLCLWIIIQLPLPESLVSRKQELLDKVLPAKDPDCLGSKLLYQTTIYWGAIALAPATPSAVMHLLNHYNIHHSINWHQIAVIGESDLIWKPLAKILSHMWWYVHTFNEHSNQQRMRAICKESDIIIATTWKLHLVDEEFVRDDQSQIVIDVGRWVLDNRPTWDVYQDVVAPRVAAITPVPWWVWPVTVASLFWNIVMLYTQRSSLYNTM